MTALVMFDASGGRGGVRRRSCPQRRIINSLFERHKNSNAVYKSTTRLLYLTLAGPVYRTFSAVFMRKGYGRSVLSCRDFHVSLVSSKQTIAGGPRGVTWRDSLLTTIRIHSVAPPTNYEIHYSRRIQRYCILHWLGTT